VVAGVERCGAIVRFLPPCSHAMNPIEPMRAFAHRRVRTVCRSNCRHRAPCHSLRTATRSRPAPDQLVPPSRLRGSRQASLGVGGEKLALGLAGAIAVVATGSALATEGLVIAGAGRCSPSGRPPRRRCAGGPEGTRRTALGFIAGRCERKRASRPAAHNPLESPRFACSGRCDRREPVPPRPVGTGWCTATDPELKKIGRLPARSPHERPLASRGATPRRPSRSIGFVPAARLGLGGGVRRAR